MLRERSQSQKDCMIVLNEIFKIAKGERWLPGAGGRRKELLFNGCFSFIRLRSPGALFYNNVNILNTIKLYT